MNLNGLPQHKNQISWNLKDFKTEFKTLKKHSDALEKTVTFVVCQKSNFPQIFKLKEYAQIKVRLEKDSKKYLEDKNLERPALAHNPYKIYSYDFIEGGSFVCLVLEPSIDTFCLHECLRKGLSGPLKTFLEQNEGLLMEGVLDVQRVDIKTQELVVEGVGALSEALFWKSPSYKKQKDDKKDKSKDEADKKVHEIGVLSELKNLQLTSSTYRGQIWGKSLNLVRTLSERAGNDLDPGTYVEEIKKLATSEKIKFEYWDESALEKKNAGAFLAVSRANTGKTSSGIVKLSVPSRNTKSKTRKNITLVGKGLCFDTGGYNIKTGSYMYGMHADMTGSAVALATLLFLREAGESLNITAFLAISENLISPTGFRPNDVVISASGQSIEVMDTDAEGRMVLADTLFFASEENPDLIVDYATLTGMAPRAIGIDRCAVFSNNKAILKLAHDAGELSGERVWGFPIEGTYERSLKSDIADIKQLSKTVYCDHIYAATFLSRFVSPEVKWLHVDLSAHEHAGGLGLVGSETTAFGVLFTYRVLSKLNF